MVHRGGPGKSKAFCIKYSNIISYINKGMSTPPPIYHRVASREDIQTCFGDASVHCGKVKGGTPLFGCRAFFSFKTHSNIYNKVSHGLLRMSRAFGGLLWPLKHLKTL